VTHRQGLGVQVSHGVCQLGQAGQLLRGLLQQAVDDLGQHRLQGVRAKLAHHGSKVAQQSHTNLQTLFVTERVGLRGVRGADCGCDAGQGWGM